MTKPKIVHILADGKRVESIEGHVIPADNPVYRMLLEVALQNGGENEEHK